MGPFSVTRTGSCFRFPVEGPPRARLSGMKSAQFSPNKFFILLFLKGFIYLRESTSWAEGEGEAACPPRSQRGSPWLGPGSGPLQSLHRRRHIPPAAQVARPPLAGLARQPVWLMTTARARTSWKGPRGRGGLHQGGAVSSEAEAAPSPRHLCPSALHTGFLERQSSPPRSFCISAESAGTSHMAPGRLGLWTEGTPILV